MEQYDFTEDLITTYIEFEDLEVFFKNAQRDPDMKGLTLNVGKVKVLTSIDFSKLSGEMNLISNSKFLTNTKEDSDQTPE